MNTTTPGRFEVSMKVAVVSDGQLLVLLDAETGHGDLPGGRISDQEMLRPWTDAVRRELVEELGPDAHIALSDAPVLSFPHVILATGSPALGLLWEGTWVGGEIALSAEHAGLTWVPLDSRAIREALSPTQASAVLAWMAQGA